jgi:DNA repair exonuclease SbcCD ATPase subunit
LKEKVASVSLEHDAELKNCQRLKSKNAQLKAADELRAKNLDEDRRRLAKQSDDLAAQVEENNSKLRKALASLSAHQQKHASPTSSSSAPEIGPSVASTSQDTDPEEISRLRSQLAECTSVSEASQAKIADLTQANAKLEETMSSTIQEFEKLDEFTRSLQERYEAIQTWYAAFEDWNQSASCSSCGEPIGAAAIIDKRVEEMKNTVSNESDQSVADPTPSGTNQS